MKIFLVLLIIVSSVIANDNETGSMAAGFRLKYGYGTEIGKSYFYDIARNETQAIADGMVKATPPERSIGPLSQMSMYCLDSFYYFCVLYDNTGYVGGIQVGYPKEDMSNATFNATVQGFVSWNVTLEGGTTEFWVTHAYFVSSDTLELNAETRIESRNPNKILQEGGLWVTGFYEELYYMPDVTSEMANNSYTRQGCFPWMGLHYYYNITEDTVCTSDVVLPWFAVMNFNDLAAFSVLMPGQLTVRSGAKDVFETSNSTYVKMNVPNAPQCFYDLADNPGVITMHVYVVDEPWSISCDNQ